MMHRHRSFRIYTPSQRTQIVRHGAEFSEQIAGGWIAAQLTVIPESQGFRLCIEGFVPFEEVPVPNPQSQPDKAAILSSNGTGGLS
jgi:hypothetical protein